MVVAFTAYRTTGLKARRGEAGPNPAARAFVARCAFAGHGHGVRRSLVSSGVAGWRSTVLRGAQGRDKEPGLPVKLFPATIQDFPSVVQHSILCGCNVALINWTARPSRRYHYRLTSCCL